MIKTIYFILILTFIRISNCWAQHKPLYSGYLFNGLVINPAYAGQQDALSTAFSYRNQWVGVPNSPITYIATAHTPLINKQFSTGLMISHDKYGIISTTEIINSYSFRFLVAKTKISLGAQIGYTFNKNNYADLEFTEPENPHFTQNTMIISPQLGFGIYISNKKYFIGASIPSISINNKNPNLGYSQHFLYGGYNILLNENFVIKPSILFRNISGTSFQSDLNLLTTFYQKVNIGISYRVEDALVFLGFIKVNKQLLIGYSYDYTLNPLKSFNKGSHEITIRYDFKFLVKDLNLKTFK